MPEGLRLALTTFTVAPLRPSRIDRQTAGAAITWSPVVGAGLALAATAVLYVGRLLFQNDSGPWLPAVLAIATLAALTRGLHLDGLADTADGLGSHRPPHVALQIMKQPDVGAFGVSALVLNFLIQVSALGSAVVAHRGTESLVLAVLAGRLTVVWACTSPVPAARPDGLGATVAGTVRPFAAWAWTAAIAAEAALYGRFDPDAGSVHTMVQAMLALGFAVVAARSLRRHAVRRLGGITGDVLGALVEVSTCAVLVVMAVDIR
jgi:adenosylcobinamide-GDP ribazoletransferase